MQKFKVGDRVRVIGGVGYLQNAMQGRVGTVASVRKISNLEYYSVLIDGFDNPHTEGPAVQFHANQLVPWLGDDEDAISIARIRYTRYCAPYKSANSDPNYNSYKIKSVIYNRPATIVFWKDGTKTVVKCENEEFDPEKGLAMAIAKKVLGNGYHYYDVFKRWLPND